MAQRPIGPADRKKLDAALPQLCELLRAGNFFEIACAALRLNPSCARARLRLANTDLAQPSDVRWATEVECARANAITDLTAEVRAGEIPPKSGGPDWKSRAWLLIRLRPSLFHESVIAKAAEAEEKSDDKAEKPSVNIFPPTSETAKQHGLEALETEIKRLREDNEALKARAAS